MKILLVSPESPDTFWSLKNALKFISKRAHIPPLGLLTVAAMLPEAWEKKLVDMTVTKLHDKDIQSADYVFLTGMFVEKEFARGVVDRCKNLGTKVVAGGPMVTGTPDYWDDVDHLILNEAEVTLPQFLEDLDAGCPKRVYETGKWADVEDSPIPLWDLLDKKPYAMMCVQYSRGCPFNCDFCDVTKLFGHKMRTKGKEQIVRELDSIYSTGWRGQVFFVDDNFIGNKQKLKKEILPAIIEWMNDKKHPFIFNTQASINLADDDELMGLMTRAGFDCVFIGIETADEASLSECNKTQNKGRNMIECVRKIQQSGMQVQAGFILGFDSDIESVFDNLIKFIQQSGIVTAMVGLLNAPRGTQLHKRMMSENRLLKDSTGNNTDFSMNFIPKMNHEVLMQGYRNVVQTIYSPKHYYQRVVTFLKNYRPAENAKPSFQFCNVKAFIRSMWRIGIFSKERFYYWRLLAWSFRHPSRFQLAVTFAIYGFHFRRVFDKFPRV